MSSPSPPVTALPAAANERVLIALSLLALYVIWGSTYLAIRFALESFPPFVLAGSRFLAAGVVLYGVLRLRGVPAPSALQWRNAAVTGLLLLGLGNGLVCFAGQRVSSGIAAVAVASMPLFAAVFTASSASGRTAAKQWAWRSALPASSCSILAAVCRLRD